MLRKSAYVRYVLGCLEVKVFQHGRQRFGDGKFWAKRSENTRSICEVSTKKNIVLCESNICVTYNMYFIMCQCPQRTWVAQFHIPSCRNDSQRSLAREGHGWWKPMLYSSRSAHQMATLKDYLEKYVFPCYFHRPCPRVIACIVWFAIGCMVY